MLEIRKSWYRENVEAFAIAVVTILAIIIFIMQSFLVQGSSMDPTLADGERLIVNKFVYWFREPRQGEIVVLKPPNEPNRKYIKRIIAGSKDNESEVSVEIRDSKVYVNSVELIEPYFHGNIYSDYPRTTVPKGMFFVMGDNRNNSKDSRDSEVGFIPRQNIVGKAIFIFWPFFKIQALFMPKYQNGAYYYGSYE
jgi:signal peptidase I